MKTLEDLVDKLNENNLNCYKFELNDLCHSGEYAISCFFGGNQDDIIYVFKTLKNYRFLDLTKIDTRLLDIIVDFFHNTKPEDWFQEKKYNIIIGESRHPYYYQTAYQKCENGRFMIQDAYDVNFASDEFQFTEKDIEELKVTLPENMAKIVELGKVEVGND